MTFGFRRPSIKEAVDNLPSGILFYRANGLVVLCNHAMNDISLHLLGEPLQDGVAFWKAVGEHGVEIPGGKLLLHVAGKSWLMSVNDSLFEGAPIREAHAENVTEQTKLTKQLAEENERIRAVSERLRLYNDDVLELTAQRELLERKAHIHDELGRLLSETKYFLGGGMLDEAALWRGWRFNAELMLAEARRPDEDLLASLHQAASDVGVTLQVNGAIPEDALAADLLFAVTGESLTNLLRHAEGDELRITIEDLGKDYLIEVSNNGKAPASDIVEGGGLTAIRRKAESIGGFMRITSTPEFVLSIKIPRRHLRVQDADSGR